MAGYIGKSQGVTQVDGYNRSEADTRYVNTAGDTMTGALTVNAAGQIFEVRNADTYSRFTAPNGSAQLGLFRSGESAGGFYIGGDAGNFRVFDSSFSPLLLIDSVGRVKTPYQPCAIVKLDNDNSQGGQNSTIGPTGTNPSGSIIKFENVRLNTGSHYSTSTGQFTCPIAGVYEVRFNSNINTGTGGFPAYPMIYRNNSLYLRAYDSISVSGWSQQSISALINCGAGDTLDIRLYVNSGYMWADSDVDYTQASFRLLG